MHGGEQVEVAVVGGGQAGLALGYELARRGLRYVVLDASPRAGHSWRSRWDSLRLFTPHPYNDLPGIPFPGRRGHYPTKDEVADYLEHYARAAGLALALGCRVLRVSPAGDSGGYLVETSAGNVRARQVVAATGPYQQPLVPALAARLDPEIAHIHSAHYRRPGQLPPGPALVVGAGNSGVQIAEELSATRPVWLAVGARSPSIPAAILGRSLFWWLYTTRAIHASGESPLGRLARRREALVGTSLRALAARHGVRLLGRALEAEGDRVLFAGGAAVRPRSVVWATGYGFDYGWLDVPVLDARGAPVHRAGAADAPGFWFLGLPWQRTSASALLGGVGRDAAALARQIEAYRSRGG